MLGNDAPAGGFLVYRERGHEASNVATWLHDAGYRTALIGKYLNDYEKDPAHVPPGWDRWFAYAGKGKYDNYCINDQGVLRDYGKGRDRKDPNQYQTDVLAREAVAFVEDAPPEQPLFLYLAPAAPHEPAIPAPRHENAPVARAGAPRPPSFNEPDMADKPRWASQPPLTGEDVAGIDAYYVDQLRTMLAVEETIDAAIDALERTGRGKNTYLFFTSDNGYHHGEHRIAEDKQTPFEEAIRVPLVVIGPGVPAGTATDALTSNIDLAPTIADLAGLETPSFVDGRSLTPLLGGDVPTVWRDAVLSELLSSEDDAFVVLRTGPYAYVAFDSGAREMYDVVQDPYQLENFYGDALKGLIADLETRLDALAECGAEKSELCQDVDGGS